MSGDLQARLRALEAQNAELRAALMDHPVVSLTRIGATGEFNANQTAYKVVDDARYEIEILHEGKRYTFNVVLPFEVRVDDEAWWPKVFDDMRAEIAELRAFIGKPVTLAELRAAVVARRAAVDGSEAP